MDWLEFWKFFGGTTAAIAAVAWLVRSLVTHVLSKDVEKFKRELERQTFEHQVRYRRVDEKVAKHLEDVYAQLVKLYLAFADYVEVLDLEDEMQLQSIKTAAEAGKDMRTHLLRSRIHLPPGLYSKTRELVEKYSAIVDAVNDYVRADEFEGDKSARLDWAFGEWVDNAMPLLDELVAAYQSRLGISDDPDYQPKPERDMCREVETVTQEHLAHAEVGPDGQGTEAQTTTEQPTPDSPRTIGATPISTPAKRR